MIIVIDGPAGSGKSSTAKAIANNLGIQYLDSGAIYRAVTLIWIEQGKPPVDNLLMSLSERSFHFSFENNMFHVFVDGNDITDKIRSEKVSGHVSETAANKRVREFVNQLMREAVKSNTFIADGRDLGSAVFPDAFIKFYMDAAVETRAERRFLEINEKGNDVSFDDVKKNIEQRDRKDTRRSADPLKKVDDAIVIDTTSLTFSEQVDKMCTIIKQRIHKLKH